MIAAAKAALTFVYLTNSFLFLNSRSNTPPPPVIQSGMDNLCQENLFSLLQEPPILPATPPRCHFSTHQMVTKPT